MNGEVMGYDEGPERVESRKSNIGQKIKKFLRMNIFLFLILCGITVGIVMGVCIRIYHPEFAKTRHNVTNVYEIKCSQKNVTNAYGEYEIKCSQNVTNATGEYEIKCSKNVTNADGEYEIKCSEKYELKCRQDVTNTEGKYEIKCSQNVTNADGKYVIKCSQNVTNADGEYEIKCSQNVTNADGEYEIKCSKNVINVINADGEYEIKYNQSYDQKKNVMYLYFPGDLFLRMLKLMIIPLVASSLIAGMAAIPSKASGRMGGFAVLYYMITTVMAVLLGILLVATIKPGVNDQGNDVKRKDNLIDPADALLDLIRNAIPSNIIAATFAKAKTSYAPAWEMRNLTNETGFYEEKCTKYITDFKVGTTGGTNVLGIVVFAVVLGVIIGKMGAKGLPLRRFMDSLQEAIIRIVRIIMWYSPIGIAFILANKIVDMDDPEKEFKLLGMYMATVIVGLIIHGFIVLPIIYVIFVRRNPFKLLVHVSQALLTALGTASSSATMPITLSNLVYNAGIDRRVVYFVIPVGATINMDGTALYEAVASIFIAQMEGYTLDAGQYVIVSVTATAAAIGAAGVPEAGLVTMMIVLQALGLPTELVGLILAVDWFLDRLRTTINVWGDSIGTGVVQALARKQLEQLDDDLAQMEDIDVHDNYGYEGVESIDKKPPAYNGNYRNSSAHDSRL